MLIFLIIFKYLLIIICLLIGVAYFTHCDRKIMAAMQRRTGPSIIGFWGLLQPLADGLKLFLKEFILPNRSDIKFYVFAPCLIFMISLINWIVIPSNSETVLVNINLSLLFIMAISSIGVYGIILAGWFSNSNYSILGAIRSVAQFISYELSITLILLPILINTKSFNLIEIIEFQVNYGYNFLPFLPLFILFTISMLAETNRVPFDLPEAESELVAGYNLEFSGFGFALYFLAEYSNMLFITFLNIIIFFSGYANIGGYFIFLFFFCFFFVWVRATLPRFRYDQLLKLCWKVILPLSFIFLFFYFCIFSLQLFIN